MYRDQRLLRHTFDGHKKAKTNRKGHVVGMLQQIAETVHGGTVERCSHFIAEERPDYLIDQLLIFFRETAS